MAKIILEFDDIDDSHDLSLCCNRHKLASMLYNIENYARGLRKYEERNEIPTEEVVNKIQHILSDWYVIQDL